MLFLGVIYSEALVELERYEGTLTRCSTAKNLASNHFSTSYNCLSYNLLSSVRETFESMSDRQLNNIS